MQGKRYFPLMYFQPLKLIESRKQVEKRFGEYADHWIWKKTQMKLPDLLAKIRALPMDLEVIGEFGRKLSRIESRILIYEYPYHQEEKLTQKKIILVLIACYRPEIGRKAWEIFQTQVDDNYLPSLLKIAFQKSDSTFLGLQAEARQQLTAAFEDPDRAIQALSNMLIHTDQKAADVLASWKIKQHSRLDNTLLKEMLINGIHDDNLIDREGISFITTFLDNLTLEDYKQIIKPYISGRDYKSFHYELMNQGIQKLGDPRHQIRSWQFLSKDELEQVKLWVMQQDLESFFGLFHDNERFDYWKRFLKYMRDVHSYKDIQVLCMDFSSFVVVEFGKIGAAYFYHREGFYKVILKSVNNRRRRKVDHFKYKEAYYFDGYKLFINKLDHHKNWSNRFDQYMPNI